MASYTYPVPAKSGALTAAEIHLLLSNPDRVAKRVLELSEYKFLADFILGGRYVAQGGAVLYETGEEIFPADDPRAVAAGAEYPLTVMTEGELAAAKTTKWGLDTIVTDERIARQGMDPVNRALSKLVNGNVRYVDGAAIGVITSKVTATTAVGAWTTGAAIVEGVLNAKALQDENLGINMDTVVLKGTQFAKVVGRLVADDLLPRENGNLVLTGVLPINAFGLTWVTSPSWTSGDPLLVDREQLGGMADEDLQSPGYSRSNEGPGVETKVIRQDENDRYRLRARRVTVPVVVEPKAATFLTGHGL